MEITDSSWKSRRKKKLGWWVNLPGNLLIGWVRFRLISMPAADVVLWLPTFFTEFLVPLAGSRVSNVREWNPLPSSFRYPLPSNESKRSSGHRVGSGRAGRRVRETKRGSGRRQEHELQGWCWESREWLLGQSEKGPMCSNRSRLMGEVELKAWIKQKIKTNMWKEENGQRGCQYVHISFSVCCAIQVKLMQRHFFLRT